MIAKLTRRIKNLILKMRSYWLKLRVQYWALMHKLPARTMTIQTRHGLMSFSTKDDVIGRTLFLEREFGCVELYKAVNLLRDHHYLAAGNSGYVIDVGANIGTVCLTLVQNGDFERALAFEPDPENFKYLRRNILQNELSDRISAYQMGLSANERELLFERCDDNSGDHRIRMDYSSAPMLFNERNRKVITVPVQSLDYTLQQLQIKAQEIQLIHIDVQGHEWYVLQGAQQTLAAGIPVVVEIWPYGLQRANTDIDSFIGFVSKNFKYLFDLRQANVKKQSASAIKDIFDSLGSVAVTDVLLLNH